MTRTTGTGAGIMTAAALILAALCIAVCSAAEDANALTGKWGCTELEIEEDLCERLRITLSFEGMEDRSGLCTVTYETDRPAVTVEAKIEGNQLILYPEDGEAEIYRIFWNEDGSFTLASMEGKMLFTKE